ncbi:MAG: type IV pilus twitching motility protein PilT [Candidatus Omnitrophica bacterium]|nr:type IV pilus twitching motility protein PilT [Candidatus Omnitrophota bacterium]
MVTINELLKLTMDKKASDLHITVNQPPILRIDGRLYTMTMDSLSGDETKSLIYSILTDDQKAIFERDKELDFSFTMSGLDRFRVNVHYQRTSVEAAFRRIPKVIPGMDQLDLPPIAYELLQRRNGLILLTGPTGTGKSTTMAAMIDVINSERQEMIVCIEDPIEFYHENRKSIIKQREVYADTHSFPEALKRCLRQDPDVIVVGEMRDLETIATTITAAETGHLVLGTIHTSDAPQTVQRIIDVFPPHQQKQVRVQLADCLQGVISQNLLPRADGQGRRLATEVMISTPGIRNLIREGEIAQIPSLMQMGAQYGMHTMDHCLKELVQTGVITMETAMTRVRNPLDFKNL